jgi:hypothetical protein
MSAEVATTVGTRNAVTAVDSASYRASSPPYSIFSIIVIRKLSRAEAVDGELGFLI